MPENRYITEEYRISVDVTHQPGAVPAIRKVTHTSSYDSNLSIGNVLVPDNLRSAAIICLERLDLIKAELREPKPNSDLIKSMNLGYFGTVVGRIDIVETWQRDVGP